jgi:glycolate oxidase iron-sulfur subunit
MARAVEACVHCGFCLPACPTYRVLGEEMDSPRGRIVLMKQALEGELSIPDVLPYIDRCLGCLACVTACPSGVRYGDLLTPFRAMAQTEARPASSRLRQRALVRLLESPKLFRLALYAGSLARRAPALLPPPVRRMLSLLPSSVPPAQQTPSFVPAQGARRARVALLTGCVQQVLAPEINHATLRVLTANGVDVVVPRGQGCCGALAVHEGHAGHARMRAARILEAFPTDVDATISTAAGCGSAMKEYAHLFAGTSLEVPAGAFGARVCDVSEFLDDLGMVTTVALPTPLTIAYHDTCHLSHAQRVRTAPRRLLAHVENLTIREVPDAEICCGSAGLYNVEHPDIGEALGAAKATAIVATGAEAVVTGNVGCLVQIATHLDRTGHSLPVLHTMEMLARGLSAGGA